MAIKLSLIIPFYNEKNICQNYKKLVSFLKTNFPSHELILVNDGSRKGFVQPLKKIIKRNPKAKLISYSHNYGRGYAVKQGFQKAQGKYLAYLDADLEIKPLYLKKAIPLLKKYPAAIASKFHPQSEISAPLFRKIASQIFNILVRFVLGSKVKDHQAGLKAFRREIIKPLLPQIQERRWLFDIELLYLIQKRGYDIKEIPAHIRYGFSGTRHSFFSEFLKMILTVFLIKKRHEQK